MAIFRMDFDNLFGDIYTLPSDNLLDISSFVVTVGGAGHDGQQGQQGPSSITAVGYNNSNNCVDSNPQTDINHQAGDGEMVRTSIMYYCLPQGKRQEKEQGNSEGFMFYLSTRAHNLT